MSRYIVMFSIVLVASIGSVQRATSQEDIERTLTRAQNLYYEARFKDSVDLLLPVDAALRDRPTQGGLTIGVKLQLALSYVGQNLTREAKAAFQEVCVLDPEYSLDSSQFSPKVIALFNDAKAVFEKAGVFNASLLPDGQVIMVVDQRVGSTGVGACYGDPMP